MLTCYFLFGSARPEVSISMPGRVMVPPFQLGMMKEEEEVGSRSWFAMEEEERA